MQLAAAGSSKAPEITSLFCLSGRFTRGRASEDMCSACWWFLIWPELGAEVGVFCGWRSLLPSHPSEAQSRFLDQKKKPEMLKPDNPRNHPAQSWPECFPQIINPPRCFMKRGGKKKRRERELSGQRSFGKGKLYLFSSWILSVHINMVIISLRNPAVKEPA